MKLAFSRPTLHAAEQRELFASFRAAGFDGLQLKGGQYAASLAHAGRFREEWSSDAGVVSALITGGTLDLPGILSLRRLIRFAAAVGSERIDFCHGIPRSSVTAGDLGEFARRLGALALESREKGVALSLHHHYDQPVMHRPDFDHFFSAAPPGSVGLTVDTAHLVKSGITDIAAVIRDFREVIDNIHLKDFARGEFQVLGTGEIDFDPIFAALGDVGYSGWLCADEESGAGIRDGLSASHRFLLEQIGSTGRTAPLPSRSRRARHNGG
jgi:sugar phosphate isomerase/epimerase